MAEPRERSDLVLNPGEYAFVQDRSKGHVSVNVGPFRTTMSETDSTVAWNNDSRRFLPVEQARAVQPFVTVPDGDYVVLSNPSDSDPPAVGRSTIAADLQQGRRLVRRGPLHFPLWPGQVAKVIPGHQLRSNEYLLVRVYNDEEAKKNWEQAVLENANSARTDATAGEDETRLYPEDLRTGQILVIRGNEVSFFIPPTGIEVLEHEGFVGANPAAEISLQDRYVRQAVSLESLEYCILKDEDGSVRYERGPSVVFPEPTERFVEKHGEIKFRATELTINSGVHVKVIAAYEEGDKKYDVGDELFFTGKDHPIYYPRQEHAIMKYGASKGDGGRDAVNYAVTIPAGDGRYLLDKTSGRVNLTRGPRMLLPDPRTEVIVQRILDPGTVALWYPGNAEAVRYNETLRQLQEKQQEEDSVAAANYLMKSTRGPSYDEGVRSYAMAAATPTTPETTTRGRQLVGATFKREETFTPPRTITLNTKYDGAVAISPWVGHAVQVISKSGKRKVVTGPETILLEYDEILTIMSLSTGTPKRDNNPYRTPYLRIQNNRVSDVVEAITKDLVNVKVTLSYRVNFESGLEDKWFAVDNYIQLLCEHAGSRIKNTVKRLGIEEFFATAIDVVRDTVLGAHADGAPRPGLVFPENGMRVTDIEVAEVKIDNPDIARLMISAQHTTVQETLAVALAEHKLERAKRLEEVRRATAEMGAATDELLATLKREALEREGGVKLLEGSIEDSYEATRKTAERELQEIIDTIFAREQLRDRASGMLSVEIDKARMEAETAQIRDRMAAFSDKWMEGARALGDQAVLERMVQAMAPLAILQDRSVQDVVGKMIDGTAFGEVLKRLTARTA